MVLQLADPAHLRLQLIGHMGCLLRIGERQHDHELIPALPGHRVFVAHHRLQPMRDLDQQAVPYLLTERVVHVGFRAIIFPAVAGHCSRPERF